MNADETPRLLRVLAAAYQGTAVDDDVVELWTSRLGGWPFDAVMATAIEWIDNERRFPPVSEFLTRLEDRARRIKARAELDRGPCAGGCADGWVEVVADGSVAFRPCEVCRPEAYQLWAGGHFEPGHHCPDCEDRRKGGRRTT